MKFKQISALLFALFATAAPVNSVGQVEPASAFGQTLTTLRTTELRSDKLGSATVLSNLPSGASIRLVSAEGGWLLVETNPSPERPAKPLSGWVRASAVNWRSGNSAASNLDTGREAQGNMALTLGTRGMPPRVNRHALIIGVGRYADAATPPLPGVRVDRESATQMARAMQVPTENIRYLHDEQATGSNIRKAISELTEAVRDGDRVFIHYSGHGTRFYDEAVGGCVEALRAYDDGWNGVITNREMASLLKGITNKTDKMFVLYDACYSGGLVQTASVVRTRGFSNPNDEGVLRPKFATTTEECARPANVKTRSLMTEVNAKGVLPADIVHISASRENEISFDDELKGGLATQFMRDCILREAKDTDNSGAITMKEIQQCAQAKINKRMANDVSFKPPTLVLTGNEAFVPAWFSLVNQPESAVSSASSKTTSTVPQGAHSSASHAPAPSVALPNLALTEQPALSGEQALRQIYDQRDAKRRVRVTTGKDKLRIGKDLLAMAIQSERAGFVYVAMAGYNSKSLYLLFPNDLDKDNRIEAGQQLLLPRPGWHVSAAGPEGKDTVLVMVTDAPRNLASLAATKAGPFVTSLNDAQGRARLGALMTTSEMLGSAGCSTPLARGSNGLCSDAFGASILSVEEIK